MCPIHNDCDNSEYKTVRVQNIVATFERLSIEQTQARIIRSESAKGLHTRGGAVKRRNAKSEANVAVIGRGSEISKYHACANLSKIENVDKEQLVHTRSRLTSIQEPARRKTSGNLNLVAVRARAQAILKKYAQLVYGDSKGPETQDCKTPDTEPYTQSIFLTDNHSDCSSTSGDFYEEIDSRHSSVSLDDEYVSLTNISREHHYDVINDGYSVAHPLYNVLSHSETYAPIYENVGVLKRLTAESEAPVEESKTIEHPTEHNQPSYSTDASVHKDKKQYLVDELISTESRYIEDLQFVTKNYMEYLSARHTGCPMRKYKYIFMNIEMICSESCKLLEDIKLQKYNYEGIGHVFCRNKNLFDRYPVYCMHKKKSQELIKSEYREIIEERQQQIQDVLGLGSYLLKPIQRLPRYEMLLRKLYKNLRLEGVHVESISTAINLMHRMARKGNDLIIIGCIEEIPHCISDTGVFIMADSFKMLSPKKMEIELFLFSKMIIFATKKGVDNFHYKTYIPVDNLTKSSSAHKTTFILEDYYMRKRHKDPKYILDANSLEKKTKWIDRIDKILWDQLQKCKELAQIH